MSETKTKFKVGDTVKCIDADPDICQEGNGWSEGLKFTITRITNIYDKGKAIYWPAEENNGVYEPWLQLINGDWDE